MLDQYIHDCFHLDQELNLDQKLYARIVLSDPCIKMYTILTVVDKYTNTIELIDCPNEAYV